jgi:sigma-54-interacting transcriptional regulator
MECDSPTADRPLEPFHSELTLAQRAPGCILISGCPEVAWETARKIARGCGSGLAWIDCDRVAPDEMADLLHEHVMPEPQETPDRILFLREVQVLSPGNQQLLDRLLTAQKPLPGRPRLIASSSLALYDWVRAGLFDEALFYKLNSVHLTPQAVENRDRK